MTVKNLESLVLRGVGVLANETANDATERRIGGKASGQAPASLSLSSPNYPVLNTEPDERTWPDRQDAVCRAGRPGRVWGVPSRSMAMRKATSRPMHRGQVSAAALATVRHGDLVAIAAIADA